MARTRPARTAPLRLILDSGAVIALSRNDQRARATLTAAWEAGAHISIPSVVLAETVRGAAEDAPANRVLRAVGDVRPADEATGRLAGAMLGAARSAATIDALVVASAIEAGGGVLLTGDPTDLHRLAEAHPKITIEPL